MSVESSKAAPFAASKKSSSESKPARPLTRACEPCARAKRACDGETPCKRCIRMETETQCVKRVEKPRGRRRARSTDDPSKTRKQPAWHGQNHTGKNGSEMLAAKLNQTKQYGLSTGFEGRRFIRPALGSRPLTSAQVAATSAAPTAPAMPAFTRTSRDPAQTLYSSYPEPFFHQTPYTGQGGRSLMIDPAQHNLTRGSAHHQSAWKASPPHLNLPVPSKAGFFSGPRDSQSSYSYEPHGSGPFSPSSSQQTDTSTPSGAVALRPPHPQHKPHYRTLPQSAWQAHPPPGTAEAFTASGPQVHVDEPAAQSEADELFSEGRPSVDSNTMRPMRGLRNNILDLVTGAEAPYDLLNSQLGRVPLPAYNLELRPDPATGLPLIVDGYYNRAVQAQCGISAKVMAALIKAGWPPYVIHPQFARGVALATLAQAVGALHTPFFVMKQRLLQFVQTQPFDPTQPPGSEEQADIEEVKRLANGPWNRRLFEPDLLWVVRLFLRGHFVAMDVHQVKFQQLVRASADSPSQPARLTAYMVSQAVNLDDCWLFRDLVRYPTVVDHYVALAGKLDLHELDRLEAAEMGTPPERSGVAAAEAARKYGQEDVSSVIERWSLGSHAHQKRSGAPAKLPELDWVRPPGDNAAYQVLQMQRVLKRAYEVSQPVDMEDSFIAIPS